MKRIRLSKHAEEQAAERGATRPEMEEAVRKGSRESATRGREMRRYNFVLNVRQRTRRAGTPLGRLHWSPGEAIEPLGRA